MNSSDKFWLGVWAIGAITLVSLLISLLLYNHGKNNVLVELVKNGASAIEAACALEDSLGNNPTCVISVTKSTEK